MRRLSFSMILVACLIGCAHAPVPLVDIPLSWQPTNSLVESGTSDLVNTPVQVGEFVDARKDHAAIGENREDPAPKPVTTRDDVARFVTEHLRDTLQKSGLDVVDTGGKVMVGGQINDFFVTETDVYRGEVTLRVTATDASGKTLWSGVTRGTATRFGHSYRADNYYNALSDALLDAIQNLMEDPGFRKTLRSDY